jgi:hypothetical protein
MMCEDMAIRAISRMTGASKNTIVKPLRDAGTVSLLCKRLQLDDAIRLGGYAVGVTKTRCTGRTEEHLDQLPAMQLGVTDHVWTIGELVDEALEGVLAELPGRKVECFTVIDAKPSRNVMVAIAARDHSHDNRYVFGF